MSKELSIYLWTYPDSYLGPTFYDYYDVIYQNRGSDTLTQANFKAMLTRLGGESDTVLVIRQGHAFCGWIEFIAVHKDDTDNVAIANKAVEDMEAYPVLDEELWSEMEYDLAIEVWNNCYTLAERVELCKEYDCSIFGARHDYPPQDDSGALFEHLVTP